MKCLVLLAWRKWPELSSLAEEDGEVDGQDRDSSRQGTAGRGCAQRFELPASSRRAGQAWEDLMHWAGELGRAPQRRLLHAQDQPSLIWNA